MLPNLCDPCKPCHPKPQTLTEISSVTRETLASKSKSIEPISKWEDYGAEFCSASKITDFTSDASVHRTIRTGKQSGRRRSISIASRTQSVPSNYSESIRPTSIALPNISDYNESEMLQILETIEKIEKRRNQNNNSTVYGSRAYLNDISQTGSSGYNSSAYETFLRFKFDLDHIHRLTSFEQSVYGGINKNLDYSASNTSEIVSNLKMRAAFNQCPISRNPSDQLPEIPMSKTTSQSSYVTKRTLSVSRSLPVYSPLVHGPSYQPILRKNPINKNFIEKDVLRLADLSDLELAELNAILRRQSLTPADLKIIKDKLKGQRHFKEFEKLFSLKEDEACENLGPRSQSTKDYPKDHLITKANKNSSKTVSFDLFTRQTSIAPVLKPEKSDSDADSSLSGLSNFYIIGKMQTRPMPEIQKCHSPFIIKSQGPKMATSGTKKKIKQTLSLKLTDKTIGPNDPGTENRLLNNFSTGDTPSPRADGHMSFPQTRSLDIRKSKSTSDKAVDTGTTISYAKTSGICGPIKPVTKHGGCLGKSLTNFSVGK